MYWIRRLLNMFPLLFLVSLGAFTLVRVVPGGPFDRERAPASPEVERALQHRYHLDEPVWQQYLRFLGLHWEKDSTGAWQRTPGGLLAGDLGPSLKYRNHSVNDVIAGALPVSMALGGMSFLFAMGLGVAWGMISAARHGHWLGLVGNMSAIVFVCVPALLLGPVLVMVFAVELRWLPPAGWGSAWQAILPVIALGLFFAARVARLVREGMLEVLPTEMVTAARARGLSESVILRRHVLRVAVLPLVAYAGPLLADLMTGSFVVENVFQIPGIGVFLVNSTLSRDYPMVVGLVVLYAAMLLVLNLIADFVLGWLDPRVRQTS